MFRTLFLYALALGIFANLANCDLDTTSSNPSVHYKQHLTLPFESRSQDGVVSITVQPNDDDQHAFGLDLIYEGLYPQSQLATQFGGFPVVHGVINYPVPPSPFSGYGSLFGWIQFVKNNTDSDWEMDIYPFAQSLDTPFGYWGYNPSVFDAPAITTDEDGNNTTIVWTAQAYLTVLGDAGYSKNVTVVPGGAFTWGFDVYFDGNCSSKRQIVIRQAEKIAVESEWSQRLPLLRETYTDWIFQDVE